MRLDYAIGVKPRKVIVVDESIDGTRVMRRRLDIGLRIATGPGLQRYPAAVPVG